MPSGIMNIFRRPLEGQAKNVLQAAINTLKERDIKGNVTSSLTSAGIESGVNIVTTINFASLDQLESIHDGFANSEQQQDSWDETAAMCKSVSTEILEIVAPLGGTPSGFTPKYMIRNVITAKRGKTQELIDVLLEMQNGIEGLKPSILKPFGSSQRVRVSGVFDSLEEVSAALNDQNLPRTKIIDLSDSYRRSVSMIQYLNY